MTRLSAGGVHFLLDLRGHAYPMWVYLGVGYD